MEGANGGARERGRESHRNPHAPRPQHVIVTIHDWQQARDPEGAHQLQQPGPMDVEQDARCGGAPFRPRHGAHTGMAWFSIGVDGREQGRDAEGHPAAGQHAVSLSENDGPELCRCQILGGYGTRG